MHLKTSSIRYDTHWSKDGNIVSVHREFESHVSKPICSGALRAEAVAAMAKIRDDYSVQTRLVAATDKKEDGEK